MKSELRIGSFAEKGLCMKNELANENSDLSLNLGTVFTKPALAVYFLTLQGKSGQWNKETLHFSASKGLKKTESPSEAVPNKTAKENTITLKQWEGWV